MGTLLLWGRGLDAEEGLQDAEKVAGKSLISAGGARGWADGCLS